MATMQPDYRTICHSNLLKNLPERTREVIVRRHGLPGQKETLEAIGRSHDITRERVRQIEEDGLKKLRTMANDAALRYVFNDFTDYLRDNDSLKREDLILGHFGAGNAQNYVHFLLGLGAPFIRMTETNSFYPFWTLDEETVKKAKKATNSFAASLKKSKQPVALPPSIPVSYIEISKEIMRGPRGSYGLKKWPQINPRGIKDKAHVVLQGEGKPLHFMQVAELINSCNAFSSIKSVIYQTVHNELIKDPRFVLVGRGLYALKEWGYEPGFVRDVIYKEIKSAKKPLTKEEIIRKVLEQRKVQPSTILLNLQNKKYFAKTSEGLYTIK